MAHIPIPNTVRTCLRYSRKGQTVCNVIHVEFPSPPTLADLNDLGAAIVAWWNDEGKVTASTDTSLEAVEMRDQTEGGVAGVDYSTSLPIAGTRLTDSLPNNVTVASKLVTGLAGRSFRGRWYWNGMTRDQVVATTDRIGSAIQLQFNNALEALLDEIAAIGAQWVVASLFSGGVPRTEGVTTPITNIVTNTAVDSQRRRLPERGN